MNIEVGPLEKRELVSGREKVEKEGEWIWLKYIVYMQENVTIKSVILYNQYIPTRKGVKKRSVIWELAKITGKVLGWSWFF
jgi:hypothetical protein